MGRKEEIKAKGFVISVNSGSWSPLYRAAVNRVPSRRPPLATAPCLEVLTRKLCLHVDLGRGFRMREDSWRQLRQEIRKRVEVRIPLPGDVRKRKKN